jgi:hypothetical protein
MVICFYCIHQSYKKKTTAPSRDLSSGHPLQEAIEVLQTTLDEKDPFLLHVWDFLCIRTPQNGAVGVTKLSDNKAIPHLLVKLVHVRSRGLQLEHLFQCLAMGGKEKEPWYWECVASTLGNENNFWNLKKYIFIIFVAT